MKTIIKIKRFSNNVVLPYIIEKGDWIDLRAAENVTMEAPQAGILKRHKIDGEERSHRDVAFDHKLIPLGVAMQLPKGFEAVVLPRSGTFKNYGIMMTNSQGIIDNSYCGDNDEWKFGAIAFKDTKIECGDRICQFKIQLSQKASMWQKIKWMLSSGIKFIEVNHLGNEDRNGFSSTGVK